MPRSDCIICGIMQSLGYMGIEPTLLNWKWWQCAGISKSRFNARCWSEAGLLSIFYSAPQTHSYSGSIPLKIASVSVTDTIQSPSEREKIMPSAYLLWNVGTPHPSGMKMAPITFDDTLLLIKNLKIVLVRQRVHRARDRGMWVLIRLCAAST